MTEQDQYMILFTTYKDLVELHQKQADKMTEILYVAIRKPDDGLEKIVGIITGE